MRAAQILTMAILVLGISGSARAQICDGALAVRINQSGLDFVVKQVQPLIPSSVAIPAVDKVVLDWPMTKDDLRVVTQAMTAKIDLHDLKLKMVTGSLRLLGRADVTTGGPVVVHNPYASFGTANCTADVKIKDLQLDVGLQFSNHGGRIRVTVSKAYVDMDQKSVLAVKGCTLGNVLTNVTNFLRKYLMGVIQSKIESIAQDKIPALIASKLGDSMQITREFAGYSITGRLDSLGTDYYGITAKLGAGVHLTQQSIPPCLSGSSYLTPPKSCVGPHAAVSAKADAMFGAGISESVLNQAIYSVWRSGKLCIDSESLKLDSLSAGLDKVGTLLGQPKGTRIAFSVRLKTPPKLKLTQTSGLQLFIKDFVLKLSLTPPGGPVNGAEVHADLAVGVKPWIDPATNSITLDVKHVSIPRLQVQNKDGTPSSFKLDPARLHRFIDSVALPMVRQKLSSTQLSPSVVNAKVVLLEMKLFEVRAGYMAAYLNGYKLVASDDKQAPQTELLKKPGELVGPQVIRVQVKGSDNRTPATLLQFSARVDNGKWSEPTYGGLVDVVTHGGVHIVEIAAVDHDGNIDPTPLRLRFVVDDKVPQLMITSRPDSLVDSDLVEVTYAGRDDRTPPSGLTFSAELYRVPDGGGMPELVSTQPAQRAVTVARFGELTDGLYKLRVIVQDEAGNVSSSDVGFVVETAGGCSLGGARPGGQAALLLLSLLLCVALRRRRA